MAGANETPSATSCFDPNGNDNTEKEDFPIDASVPQGNPKRPPGYVSSLTVDLETLDNILKEQKTKANGTVRMEMALSADLVVHSTESSKQDIENYEVVLTWSGDSDFDQQQPKSVLDDILSGTKWKISKINKSEARNCVKDDGERGNEPMESAEGEESASYISGLKLKLKTLDKTLKELWTTLNGAVRMKVPLSAMVVDSTVESGKNYEVFFTWGNDSNDLGQKQRKCAAACAQQDVKNYDVVHTMGEDSGLGPKRRKCVLHDFLFGTNWKISKKILPEAVNVVPLESAKRQSKGKKKAGP